MALSAHVGSFNITTQAAGNTVQVTGTGFQPKAIIFWWNGRTGSTDGVGRSGFYRGIGWTAGTTSRAVALTRSNDGAGTGSTFCDLLTSSCIADDPVGTPGEADLQSFDSNGFTLVIDAAFAVNLRVHYLALGGSSLTDVATGTFVGSGTAPVTQDVTGLSFQPDLVFFLTTAVQLVADSGGDVDSALSFGVANGSAGEAVWAGDGNNGSASMNTLSYCRRGEILGRFNTTVSQLNDRAEFSSFLSNGFQINWLERNGVGTICYLALKGASSVVGDLQTQTDTSTPITESGFGFRPSALLFVSAGRTESAADTPSDHDHWSMGAASSTTVRNAAAVLDEDALADSEVTTASEFDAVYANIAADSTIQGLMDVQSFDSDGFTCIMDDADPAQNHVWYLALGPAALARRYLLMRK